MTLGTYEQERIAFARRLIATTDKAFQTIVNQKLPETLLREYADPYVLSSVFQFPFTSKIAFKILSQIHINYRSSLLSKGKPELIDFAHSQSLELHEFPWEARMKDAGFKQAALYLIRPDGHVALATDKQWLRMLKMYLEAFEIVAFGAK